MAVPENEKRTPVFDWIAGDFKRDIRGNIVTATQQEAAVEVIIKALQTKRGIYLIYGSFDDDLDHKYGNDTWDILANQEISDEVRIDEIKRAIEEALVYDPWILEVYDIEVTRDHKALQDFWQRRPEVDAVYASFKVSTIFDSALAIEGIVIEGV